MAADGVVNLPRQRAALIVGLILTATISCLASIVFLLRGLIIEGPAFYNGQECNMTYSRFQFLPLHVPSQTSNKYRLLKFTDGRDPRHHHFFPISGSLVENYLTQNTKKSSRNITDGRLLDFHDNWCLLPRNEINKNSSHMEWSDVPHPHRGHPVLYVPGHWGSFSQSRSLGAHGTGWTSPRQDAHTNQKIYERLWSGRINDGTKLLHNMESNTVDVELIMELLSSQYQDSFVMDVFALDFEEEGAALHSSKILNQADFVARAIETLVEGCHIGDSQTGITIVAHSIGAWAVKASLDMNPQLLSKGWVKNVINLASPLQSIPYAVDSGVHDIVRTLNERDSEDVTRDVVIVSVSGGLRDELIPPILSKCQSESFLPNSMLGAKATTSSNKLGMDHRCIVWCFDLLTQIRDVIFTLVIATDNGMNPSKRIDIVHRIMRRTNHTTSFEGEVKSMYERVVDAKGYAALVSIQLAAPYHLNFMVKLCILAGLGHSLLLRPFFLQHRRNHYGKQIVSIVTTCVEVSISLLVIPSIVTTSALLRRLEFHFVGSSLKQCYMHECDLLLGAIFVLAQLSALVYFIIVYGVGFIVGKICRRFCSSDRKYPPVGRTFGTMLWYCSMESLRLYPFACLPFAIGVLFIARKANDNSIDSKSLAPTLFVAAAILVFGCLLQLNFKPTATNLEERRMVFSILLISLAKALYGKLIYAYSIIQGVGNENRSGSNELFWSLTSSLLPSFLAIMAVKTHDLMTQNALIAWKKRIESEVETTGVGESLNKTHSFFLVANISLFIWYMWNVLVNYSGDDIVVLLFSATTVLMASRKCYPLSSDAMNVYAAIIDDDLSFHCEVKDKGE